MKAIFIIGVTIISTQVYSQVLLRLQVGPSLSYAKMGTPTDNGFMNTGVMPGLTLGVSANNVFNISKVEYELQYALDGHRNEVLNFFEKEEVTARLVRHNIGLLVFYKPNAILISEKKRPKFEFFVKPGIWTQYFIDSSFKYHEDTTIHNPTASKSINWGGVLSFSLVKRKLKKKFAYGFDLRFYYGLMNLSTLHDTKWFTRKIEATFSIPLSN